MSRKDVKNVNTTGASESEMTPKITMATIVDMCANDEHSEMR